MNNNCSSGGSETNIRDEYDDKNYNDKEISVVSNLRYTFQLLDVNGDGLIDVSDLQHVLHSLHENISKEDIESMIQDVTDDESIGFEEFSYKIITRYREKQEIQKSIIHAFKIFDRDNTGFVEVEQLKRIMLDLDKSLEYTIDDIISPCEMNSINQDTILVNYYHFVENLGRIL